MRTRQLAMLMTLLMLVAPGQELCAHASGTIAVSHDGVTARVLAAPFSGDLATLREPAAETLSLDQLPKAVAGYPVLETSTAIVSVVPDRSTLVFWTRRDDRVTRRGEIALVRLRSASGTNSV